MKPWTFLAPLFFLALGFAVYFWWVLNPPEAGRRQPPRGTMVVEVIEAHRGNYTVQLESQGTVRAHTESSILPEVSGRIVSVSPFFRGGGFFKKGEVLIALDDRDYQTALVTAEATLAQARLRLAEEQARSDQARKDWSRLGNGNTPSSLVLREPQFLEAKANVAAAEGRLEQARRNLERTRIRAPYAGRVLEKRVDVGQFVGPGTLLGRIYAVDYAEIRLPLAEWQLGFIDLPEIRRDNSVTAVAPPPVRLTSTMGGRLYEWEGTIVRAEGAIDEASRQLFVVGQVDDPYGPQHAAPLKVGMFVEAQIAGAVLENVWIIPSEAIRQGNSVLTVSADNKLFRRAVDVLWQDRDSAILPASTFAEAPRLCVTPISFAADGLDVVVNGEQGRERAEKPRAGKPAGGPGAASGQRGGNGGQGGQGG